jgi:PEP-CTERM motif
MKRFLVLLTTVVAATWAGAAANAQLVYEFNKTGPANWYDTANWDQAGVPSGVVPSTAFGETGNVNNNRSAYVDAPMADAIFDTVSANPSAVNIGTMVGLGYNNTLEIRSGGTFRVQPDANALATSDGVAIGGLGSAGTLRVSPGGSMTVDTVLNLNFAQAPTPASQVVVGGAAAGTATLNVGTANISGVLQTYANSDFNSLGTMTVFPAGTFRPEVRSGSNAKVDVTGLATIGGTLTVDFTGFTPTYGQNWTILEAESINGNFAATNSPVLALGEGILTTKIPAAGGRQALRATYSSTLVLNVDRDSGAVSLGNLHAPNISFDGYSMRSASGRLDPNAWSSLDDNNSLGGDWRESNVSNTQLAELKPTTSGTINGNLSHSLGNAYSALAAPFGTQEDLTFDYTLPDGSIALGTVVYTGTKVNNLLLQVDPSGAAKLRNTSQTTVMIDGYDVASASGSLSTAGWTSFDELNANGGDWRESNTSQFRLAELKQAGATTLNPGASFDLGDLFTGATEDLVFSFLQAGSSQPTIGAVIYQAFAAAVPGDYNEDGKVNAADYTVWRNHLGATFDLPNRDESNSGPTNEMDYAFWKANFGNPMGAGSGAVAAAVPEPGSLLLVCLGCLGLLGRRRG